MQFIQKNIYFIASGILVTAFLVGTAVAQNQQLQCGPGEYDAGGYCRVVPTGCPYGDSVPLEKCEPQTPEEKAVAEPAPVTPQQVKTETPTCQQ